MVSNVKCSTITVSVATKTTTSTHCIEPKIADCQNSVTRLSAGDWIHHQNQSTRLKSLCDDDREGDNEAMRQNLPQRQTSTLDKNNNEENQMPKIEPLAVQFEQLSEKSTGELEDVMKYEEIVDNETQIQDHERHAGKFTQPRLLKMEMQCRYSLGQLFLAFVPGITRV